MAEKQHIDIKKTTDSILELHGTTKKSIIPVLQAIQQKFNYLPEDALRYVTDHSAISASELMSVATFYDQFRLEPVGEHMIKVCVGTACHIKGAGLVYDAFKRHLNIPENFHTDSKQLFTVDKVACLGCCTIAPVVQIDDHTYGFADSLKVPGIVDDFIRKVKSGARSETLELPGNEHLQGQIRLGLGSCCIASGSENVRKEVQKTVKNTGIHVDVKHVGCVGMCHQVPLLEVITPDKQHAYYTKVKPEDVRRIVTRHLKPDGLLKRMRSGLYNLLDDMISGRKISDLDDTSIRLNDSDVAPFLDKQVHIATEYYGEIKPTDLNEYLEKGGFQALKKCLKEYTPEDIIDLIIKSGLRGRGGGGFPTGNKWKVVAQAKGEEKYLICNVDEGDPGAFMDRMLVESYPFRIIEGMLIAAYAVGASVGYFYIRAEYPLAVKRMNEALQICRDEGILTSENGMTIDLRIFEGAGAFVCGEETALIASIEGDRGFPRYRPPFPAESGLWEQPTLINNTETYALVPWIIQNGAEKFASYGIATSKGTKVFALAGKIKRGGLIEVPMGITIREIVEDIGGGIAGGKEFKAIQIGGPSGGCIPASMADRKVDYESLIEVGAMMGSGGLIVLDESDCMVDIAKYFLAFTQDQSCGKCTFCRIGTRKMLDILEKICDGKGSMEDLETLESLAEDVKQNSVCNLGKTAPNPVISTLEYFRDEYIAHINGTCPSGKCTELITYKINDDCIGCTKCAQRCPVDAIPSAPHEVHEINTELCIRCDTCRQVCPVDAVIVE